MEILSFPGPDRSVTQEGLRTYQVASRRYRNRRIGEFLKELHLTEGRNTGFKKILNALEKNGSPKPEFETDEDRSYFITRIFAHNGFKEEAYNWNGLPQLTSQVEEVLKGYSDSEKEAALKLVTELLGRESGQKLS